MSHISVRALCVIVCIRLSGVANRKLAKKWPKIVTAAHLSNDNSKTKGVSTLNQAYPSEGVFSLTIDSEDGVPTPLCHALQSHKVQEAKTSKNGRFWPFSELGAVLAFSIIVLYNSILLLPYIYMEFCAISRCLLLLLIHNTFCYYCY